jgi:predicted nucleic acid-binding Zn ribbon protein
LLAFFVACGFTIPVDEVVFGEQTQQILRRYDFYKKFMHISEICQIRALRRKVLVTAIFRDPEKEVAILQVVKFKRILPLEN